MAELHRAGLLTVAQAPTPAEEAVRDLCRARDDARADPQRCRHRLGELLLRRGLHYPGRAWTQAHRRWVDGLNWPHAAHRVVVEDYLLAIDHVDARLGELDAQLAAAYFGGSGTSISEEVEHRFRRKWNIDFGKWNIDSGSGTRISGCGTCIPGKWNAGSGVVNARR